MNMKKRVITFGLISGGISSLLMVGGTMPLAEKIGFDKAEYLGYSILILSFLMVFFGIRSYRDIVGEGQITFARGFAVGIAITLVASVCYVVIWELLYFNSSALHGFMDKYAAYTVEKLKASGASAAAVQTKIQDMRKLKVLYEKPLFNALFTFIEPFPVGLVITLVSAAILRRKRPSAGTPLPA